MVFAHTAGHLLVKITIFFFQGAYLLSAGRIVFLAICAFLQSLKIKTESVPEHDTHHTFFSIVIPAYAEGEVLLDNVAAIKNQNYPKDRIKISVIADKVSPELIEKLKKQCDCVYDVDFEGGTKVKALRYFLGQDSPGSGEYVVVLDADNVCHPDFLKEINRDVNRGFEAVQGKRTAKNMDTVIARLDAIAECNGNFLTRKSSLFLNASCALIGSGFAMEYELFKKHILALPEDIKFGFDKELQVNLGLFENKGFRIKYCEEAICYDEKIRQRGHFLGQRARWAASYLGHIYKIASLLRQALTKSGRAGIYVPVCGVIPPYSWVCASGSLFFILALIFKQEFLSAWLYLSILIVLWTIPLSALYFEKAASKIWLTYIFCAPIFPLLFFQSIFKIKLACNKFLHTPHGPASKGGV